MAIKRTNKFLFFWQGDDIYSNFYEKSFIHKNKIFKFSEQAFMWEKAMFFGDKNIAHQITLTTHPMEAKKLGRKVKNFNEQKWDEARYEVMRDVLVSKFADKELQNQLLKDSNLTFVEASPFDKIWGIGLDMNHKDATNPNKWKGHNLLGKVLDEVAIYYGNLL